MKPVITGLLCGLSLGLASCGPDVTTRATTGAAAGAIVAGPVGAIGGAALGASGAVRVR